MLVHLGMVSRMYLVTLFVSNLSVEDSIHILL